MSSTTLPQSEQGSELPTKQPLDIADLFRELQETNRLLREIVSQKAADQDPFTDESLSPRTTDEGTKGSPPGSPLEPAVVNTSTIQLVEDLARRVFDSDHLEHLDWFRDLTLSRISIVKESSHGSPDIQSPYQVRLLANLTDSLGRRAKLDGQPLELCWDWRTGSRMPRVPLTDGEVENLRRQWLVRFDLDRSTERVSRQSGWILGREPRRNGILCACPLVYGPGHALTSANSILDECHKAKALVSKMAYPELVSPGALWHFTTPIWANGTLPLSRLALIAAVCLVNPEEEHETVHQFLHEFCAPWKPLRLRGMGREFGGWTGSSEISYQHTIRCFSNVTVTDQSDFTPYVRCHRESGEFPALPGAPTTSFTERRMSVLCRWSEFNDELSFTIVLLGDFQSVKQEAQGSNDLFTDWKDRHFTAQGKNAGYHMLQSAVHRTLISWEKEWSQCLDVLGDTVNTNLHDILSDETSNRLMFDTSYARSRVYFKTLEMLRIFGDTIRETGRDLQEMDPERLLQGSFLRAGWDARYFLRDDPATDKALWKNWRILSEFQKGAEERLMRRITEKTEEIKSLRDGLFNATSLREAARSTTMNRYVIVFTVVTVLYLPPSLTSSLFGTPLFDGEDQAETVGRFRTSTIIVCVITYVIAFLLLWLADKWETAGSLYHEAREFAASTWSRLKGDGEDEDTNHAHALRNTISNKPPLTPAPTTDRIMSV
ncbi:uncharacterized protein B0H64DRAFT_390089 [Chaetomium fimeti]|uniref:Uncharacterized protein n=1 Tax=Chaetomium fimeti TaxID=1854472 RepID=A0AAE0LT90_9PEZI|nr:hypothetical protein B0H64DRAFT_390089 [Chaetomium fimeti]